jgi:hypothetical protein
MRVSVTNPGSYKQDSLDLNPRTLATKHLLVLPDTFVVNASHRQWKTGGQIDTGNGV